MAGTLHKIYAAKDLPEGALARVEVAGLAVCLAHADDGNFYAVADMCSHEEGSLSEGYLESAEIECPLHGAVFDLRTGAVLGPPAEEPVRAFHVEERGGDLYISV